MLPDSLYILKQRILHGYVLRGIQNKKPMSVNVEPTNACNLSCSICPHGSQKIVDAQENRAIGFMTMDTYREVLNGCGENIKSMALYLHGEPFLNENLGEMVNLAVKRGIGVTVFSNGMSLNIDTKVEELLKQGPVSLNISMDLISRRGYEILKGFDGYNKACDNFSTIAALFARKTGTSQLSLRSIYQGESRKEIRAYLEQYLKTSGIGAVQVTHPFPWPGNKDANILAGKLTMDNYLVCPQVNNALNICWDGTVVPCSFDNNATYPVGNIHSATLDEIFNNKKVRYFRRSHYLGKRREIPLCKYCELPRFVINIITIRRDEYLKLGKTDINDLITRISNLNYKPSQQRSKSIKSSTVKQGMKSER
ncbi:MAG: SPASM domain-containing protein [Pseudomonadota bacterium]